MMYLIYLGSQLRHRLLALLEIYKKQGILTVFGELNRLVKRIFYQQAEYTIMTNPLSELDNNASSNLSVCQVTALDKIADLGKMIDSADMARFYQLFSDGSLVFIAYQNDQALGCCWISQKTNKQLNRVQASLRLFSGEAYMHDLFTSPLFRGRGVAQALVLYVLRYLRKSGFEQVYSIVQKNNHDALRVHAKTGYREIGTLFHWRILLWDRFKFVTIQSQSQPQTLMS